MHAARPTLALALALAACDPAPVREFGGGEVALRPGAGSGGIYLNTNAIGDHRFAELDTAHGLHDGVVLDEVCVHRVGGVPLGSCTPLTGVWSEAGELFGHIGKTTVRGDDFVGSEWSLTVAAGKGATKRTMQVLGHAHDPLAALHTYTFAYPNEPDYGLHPVNLAVGVLEGGLKAACGEDTELGFEAVVYEDLHVDMQTGAMSERPNTLHIACLSGGVGKAATWGYPAWALPLEGFQAAVRAIRADYCGDGESWTSPGAAVTLRDAWNINDFSGEKLDDESIWTPDGAACVGRPRLSQTYQTFKAIECLDGAYPEPCAPDVSLETFPGAGMLWTKLP